MFCTECGKEMSDQVAFCSACGKAVKALENSATFAPPSGDAVAPPSGAPAVVPSEGSFAPPLRSDVAPASPTPFAPPSGSFAPHQTSGSSLPQSRSNFSSPSGGYKASQSNADSMGSTGSIAVQGKGLFDRYEDGTLVVFTCLAGIIVSLIALFTFAGKWINFKISLYGYSIGTEYSLLEFSDFANTLGTYASYFDSSAGATYNIMGLAAVLSHWILLLGAIVCIVVCIVILLVPKLEPLVFIPYIAICAFAVIGLVFTAAAIVFSSYFGFMPVPIVMLIFAGVPAVVLRFLG